MRIGLSISVPGTGVAPGPSAAAIIEANSGVWWRGTEGKIVTSSPDVDDWQADTGSGLGSLDQGVTAQKPHTTATGLDFDGSAQWLQSDAAASAFTPCHQTGMTLFVVAHQDSGSGTKAPPDDCNNNINQHGFALSVGAHNGNAKMLVTAGLGSTNEVVNTTLIGGIADTDKHLYEFTWSVAAGFSWRIDGGTPNTGSIVQTPSSTAPIGPLALGRLVGAASSWWDGGVYELVIIPGVVLAGADLSLIRETLAGDHGIPLA